MANLLLEKACNAANAAMKVDKFQTMIQRSRTDYLRQFANDHVWSSSITRIRERKASPFRAIGRKRTTLAAGPNQSISELEMQTSLNGDSEYGSARNSQSITPNSTTELRKPHPKRLSREKTVSVVARTSELPIPAGTTGHVSRTRTSSVLGLTCLDFGHSFPVELVDVLTLSGRLSPAQLLRTTEPAKSDLDALSVELTMSKHWLVLTTVSDPSISSNFPAQLLLAVPTRSIFAYSLEKNQTV
ncbi:unnamed protein product [Echinostoma caproni]|uniref:PH-like domain-containing protein n=1 Tax=Echinostoma caproni TaxID=27848 RepID=A0A3P8GIP6_9TREM|nr:unnamed protein product [Echinostoma caproni]